MVGARLFPANTASELTPILGPWPKTPDKRKSINEDIPFSDIEITYSDSKPQVVIFGNHKNKYKFLASLTHDAGVAIGIVISKKLS